MTDSFSEETALKTSSHALRHVLLIDAETYVWDVVRIALQDNYRITFVATRGAAIRTLNNDPPDLVLVDLILSRAHGLPLAIHGLRHHIPVVMTTSNPDLARRLERLACPVLCKPYLRGELREYIDQAVKNVDENLLRHRTALARIRTNPRERDALRRLFGQLRDEMHRVLKPASD